jgi:Xaa-Pro aminopeptidase
MTELLRGFSPETFARRREEALKRLGGSALLLSSSPLLYRSRDTEHRYRPDSELFYLTGCTEPQVVALLMGGDQGERFRLFVPRRDSASEIWSGPRPGPEEAKERFGADAAHPLDELEDRLTELLKRPMAIFFRLGTRPELERLVVRALKTARGRGARTGTGPRRVEDPGQILDELRLRKSEEEMAAIRRATGITVEAFGEAMARTRGGMGEWEVESLLEGGFRRRGASGPAFPTIVGSGMNGCVLHYSSNQKILEGGELVLLDGGAEMDLYAGDVTRTFPVGGAFSGVQRDLYQIVLRAHGAAMKAVGPGSTVGEVHHRALEQLTRGLVEMEVLSGDPEDLLDRKAFEPFFPHQASHWLGLDVHDVGDYAVDGQSRTLEPGMVLTVEPGLYFAPTEGGGPGPLTGIGIRIEDDVLVTESGRENLTAALPVLPEDVEALVGGG